MILSRYQKRRAPMSAPRELPAAVMQMRVNGQHAKVRSGDDRCVLCYIDKTITIADGVRRSDRLGNDCHWTMATIEQGVVPELVAVGSIMAPVLHP